MSSATLGQTELGHIPIEFIERIEVIKGPLSGIYGADAVGGVVQIFTKNGGDTKSSIELQAGSFAHNKAIAAFNSSHFRFSASREQNNGIDATQNTAQGNDDSDSFEESAINLGANFNLNASTKLAITGLLADNEIEFDNTFGADTGFLTENELANLSANITGRFSDTIKWSNTLGYTENNAFTEAFAVFGSGQFDTQRLTLSSQLDVKLSEHSTFIIGSDYYDEDVTTDADFAETTRDNVGIFTQYQNQFGPIGLVANLRFDDNSAFGNETNGSIGLTYKITPYTQLSASYGTAFRAPTFNALFFPFSGNINIQPEESESVEISLRGSFGANNSSAWRVSVFDTEITNLIEFPAPNFIASNVNEASIQGVELELSTQLGHWNLAGSLNFLDAINESTDEQLILRPEQSLKFSIDRQFGNLLLGADLLAENGRFSPAGIELDNYERIDLKAAYTINKHFKLSAKIGNLTDEDTQLVSGFNTEERSIFVSGKYTF